MVLVPDLMKSLRDQLHPLLNAHGAAKPRLRPCKWSISTLARSSHRRQHNAAADPDAYRNAKSSRGPLTLR